MKLRLIRIYAVSIACLLSACGQGGSGVADFLGVTSPAAVLSGTAAIGAPIANANLAVKCASDTAAIVSGSATTAADGTYSISIAGAQFPCMLEVAMPDGSALHALANLEGVANITPLTEALVAALLGQEDVTAVYTNLNSTSMNVLKMVANTTNITAADKGQTAVMLVM